MSEPQVYILTGPIQSGKTTALLNWSTCLSGRQANQQLNQSTYGILTPIINDQRVFLNIHTREQFPMQAGKEEKEVLEIGHFVFSKHSFEKASEVIRNSIHQQGWLVIDEIGPLELQGEGFCKVLKEVLGIRKGKTLLVAREGLVEKVKEEFKINYASTIYNTSELNT